MTVRWIEIAVALLTLAFGALVTYASYQLGSSWGADGPGAGYFPFYIGSLICIGSIANLVSAIVSRSWGRVMFADWRSLGRVLAVVAPAALYIGGIYLAGIYVSSLIYIFAFMIWLGKYPWYKALSVSFGVSVVLFLMFEVWFKVPLPKGAYSVLAYFGY